MLDYRGVGDSQNDGRPFTMTELADEVIVLSEALKLERSDVICYSMGSNMALELMLRHPGKVKRACSSLVIQAGMGAFLQTMGRLRYWLTVPGPPRK